MPIKYRLDRSLGVVFATARGRVTDEELLEYARKMVNDPAIDPSLDQLIDLRDADPAAVSTDTLRRVAGIFRDYDRLPLDAKLAIAAPSDVAFGMARMYEIYRDQAPIAIRVFRDHKEARRWLGLPESPAPDDPDRDPT